MNKATTATMFSVLATTMCAAWMPAAAQLTVMASGGIQAAYSEALPAFERTSGISVMTRWGPSQGSSSNTIPARLGRGEPADVLITTKEALAELIGSGKVTVSSQIDLASVPLGVAVRAGSPKPDITTVDAFRSALLAAKSIAFPDSTSGNYLVTKLFPRLGIAEEMAAKTKNRGVSAVATGEAAIAVLPVSEILPSIDGGVTFVGPIPSEIQYLSVFTVGIVDGSRQKELAKQLIAYLLSEPAATAFRKSGMEPLGSK